METKEIKIKVPKGYEIDKENSTFERIVLKPKQVNTWTDIADISGVYIHDGSELVKIDKLATKESNTNVFLNEKYAKSALALAQISQLLPYYDSEVVWHCRNKKKYVIRYNMFSGFFEIVEYYITPQLFAFNSLPEAERFLEHNEQLLKDYFMID